MLAPSYGGSNSHLAKFRPEWDICGEGANGEEGIQLTEKLKPDVTILDITMPEMSGLEASSRMRKSGIGVPFLIFTTHDSERLDAEVREAGAQGYVLKSQAARYLVLAIDTLLAGGTFFGERRVPEPVKNQGPNRGVSYRLRLAPAL